MYPESLNLGIFHEHYIMQSHPETNLQVPVDVFITHTQVYLAGSCVTEATCADMYIVETGHLVHLPDSVGDKTWEKNEKQTF